MDPIQILLFKVMYFIDCNISLIIFILKNSMALRTNPHKQTHFDPTIYDDKCVSEICECGSHKCPPPDLNKAVKF